MKKLDWAELTGEGRKIQIFARIFVNQMIAYNLKWQEIPSKSNKVNLKVKSHPFIKGEFHAINENGNLYYNAFVKDNNALFFEILGIEILIGLFFLLIEPMLALILLTAVPLLYLWLGGVSIGIANKNKKEACPIALKTATNYITNRDFINNGDYIAIQGEDLDDGIEVFDKSGGEKKDKNILVFVSYALVDTNLFKIKEIAEKLTSYDRLEDVLYCEEDTRDNFIKYMNEHVGKCDVVLLFCSPNSLKSEFVEDEWMAARAMKKPIIPVFIKTDDIPPLLRARIGITFDPFDLQKTIIQLYNLILKKTLVQ